MAKLVVTRDVIWLSEITDDTPLLDNLRALPLGEPIELETAGAVGGCERIIDRDEAGTPQHAIRPIGPMREAWARLRGMTVDIRPVAPTYLATFGARIQYWDIPESRVFTNR